MQANQEITLWPLVIDGLPVETGTWMPVFNKYSGEPIAQVAVADSATVTSAIDAAFACSQRVLSPRVRYAVLRKLASLVDKRREQFIGTIIDEAGFPYRDAETEVNRAIETITISAEESKRICGEMIPIQSAPGFENRLAFTVRTPVGVVAAITPFNSPLNTVCHKVAPAIAAGNAVVLKPASTTPLTALLLAQAFLDAGLPAGYLNVVIGSGREIGKTLGNDSRISFYAFTGSTAVGFDVLKMAGLRRCGLELGNISATIVCEDANLEVASRRLARASFRKAGQVCTSVQRIYVESAVLDRFLEVFRKETANLTVGDPKDPSTVIGPMITEQEAIRAEAWVNEAVQQGAKVVIGGARHTSVLEPTILANVSPEMKVVCEEIFAPVVSVIPVSSLDEAIGLVNDSPYGLQAGIFTGAISTAMEAARRIDVGGVIINDTSSTRADLMPYGGIKDSGFGHEGPAYAIREMSHLKTIVVDPL